MVLGIFENLPVGQSGPYYWVFLYSRVPQNPKVWTQSAHGKVFKNVQNHQNLIGAGSAPSNPHCDGSGGGGGGSGDGSDTSGSSSRQNFTTSSWFWLGF